MPLAITHILFGIVLIEIFREFVIKNNQKFPRYYIFIAAIGSILPDFDFIAYYVLYFFGFTIEQVHRTFLHTIFIPIILFLIGFAIWKLGIKHPAFGKRHMTIHTTFFILAAGSLLHIILDFTLAGYIRPFYPFSDFSFGFNLQSLFPKAWEAIIFPSLDAALFLLWLAWMEFKLKVSDYF